MLEKQADEIRRLRLAIALLNYKPQPKKRGRPVKGPDPLVQVCLPLLESGDWKKIEVCREAVRIYHERQGKKIYNHATLERTAKTLERKLNRWRNKP
jgi:hypothetical protein